MNWLRYKEAISERGLKPSPSLSQSLAPEPELQRGHLRKGIETREGLAMGSHQSCRSRYKEAISERGLKHDLQVSSLRHETSSLQRGHLRKGIETRDWSVTGIGTMPGNSYKEAISERGLKPKNSSILILLPPYSSSYKEAISERGLKQDRGRVGKVVL